jgi:hypothetical protein
MLTAFVVTGGVGLGVVFALLVHGMRDALRGGPGRRSTRPPSRTGRWRYEAALTK